MKRSQNHKVFGYPWWGKATIGLGACACTTFAVYAYLSGTSGMLLVFYLAMAPASIIAFVQALVSRVEITQDKLVLHGVVGRREYDRASLAAVTWSAGCPVSVQSQTGEWIKLPSVFAGSQSLANSIRAWLKRTPH